MLLSDFISIYHNINRFLATDSGFLLRKSSEFILLLVVTYMIFSEWRRERGSQLKFLLAGFSILAVEKLILTLLGLGIVFGELPIVILGSPLVLVADFLELLGLIFITQAFLCGTIESGKLKKIWIGTWVMLGTYFFASAILTFTTPLYVPFIGYQILKVAVLLFAILLLFRRKLFDKFSVNVMVAFAVYAMTPLVTILNLLFLQDGRLRVLIHPFTFLSVLLLTRVVYLKLVDKVKLKEELLSTKKKYEQEKEISSMKDEFVSVVSHELRTPLTSMKLYLALLLEGKLGKLENKQQETITVVKGEADRLSMLINDILLLSKLEHAKQTLKTRQVYLAQLIGDLGWESLAHEKGVEIKNHIPKNFAVTIDPDRFKQVFLNLISNSIKFTKSGGWIQLEADSKETGWEFKVSDSGKGIPQEHIPKLFEKFYQLDDHLTRSEGGTGLGLAIVKKIVEMHGGNIQVESSVGVGSTFSVTFPRIQPSLR